MSNDGPVVYFVRRWPAPSEAFIREEVGALLGQGHDVVVWSIRRAGRGADLADAERFAGRTRILWPPAWKRFVAALISWFLRRPGLLCRFFWQGLRGDHPGFRQRAKNLGQMAVGAYAAYLLEQGRRPARLHAHFAYSGSLVARVAAALLSVPYSLTVHGTDIRRPQGLMEFKLAAADPLVTISEFNRRYILRAWPGLDPSKLRVICQGVDTRRLVPSLKGKGHEGPIRLLTVARMVPEKDPLGLVAVAKELRSAHLDVRWRCLGDGPLMAEARSAARRAGLDGVMELRGWVSHHEIDDHYAWADILVLGSRMEGLPVVLMEGMASGLAVVATAVGGVPELITSGRDGLLVPAQNSHAMAEAVARLIRDPEERARLGVAARERVRKDFELATNAARLWESFSAS